MARSLRHSMASLADLQATESPVMDLVQDGISIGGLLISFSFTAE